MLLEHNNPGTIEAELLITRSSFKGSLLLVEGSSDSRFWTTRVKKNQCELVITGGKPNLTGAMERLDRNGFSGAFGIADDDYDRLTGKTFGSNNIAITDDHDLECMLLRSAALDKVLAEWGDSGKIKQFEDKEQISVREALLQRGLAFGRLRWLSCRERWHLPFDKAIKPAEFVHEDTWIVDETRLLQKAMNEGAPHDLSQRLADLPDADPWLVCQGHDLIAILRIGLRKTLGNLKSHFDDDAIAGLLRTAYEIPMLATTELYASIRQWEGAHSPYLILA